MNNNSINIDEMDTLFYKIKELFWILLSALVSVFSPVKNVLILLFIAFMFNIISGIIAGVHVSHEKFNLKKAFDAVTQLLFYAACVIFLDYGTRLMEEPEMGTLAIKWLTYIVVYFYLTNIFRNAHMVYPKNQAISFIYELLSTEIFNRLKSYVGYKSNQKIKNDNIN